jgi:hypothetical protein
MLKRIAYLGLLAALTLGNLPSSVEAGEWAGSADTGESIE